MNRILAIGIFLVLALVGAAVIWFVGIVGIDRTTWDKVPTRHYFVQASGRDLRAYEWESELQPGKVCVALIAEANGPVGLDCDFGEIDRSALGETPQTVKVD
jgi:hypothetical protein